MRSLKNIKKIVCMLSLLAVLCTGVTQSTNTFCAKTGVQTPNDFQTYFWV